MSKPLDDSEQATLNRSRDVLIANPGARLATIIVMPAGSEQPSPQIDYGDVDPLDLTRVAGLMLRRVIRTIEAVPAATPRAQTEKLAITRQLLKAIAELPLDLGEEQRDPVAPRPIAPREES